MKNSFRELMRRGDKVIGTFMMLDSPEVLEIIAQAGFDFVCIDNEHGGWEDVNWAHLVRTAEAAGIAPIFRVPYLAEHMVKRALDIGAAGIMVPGISSAEEAREAVRISKFPPIGERGACPFVRANLYGDGDGQTYYAKANEEVSLILLVEGKRGVESFDAIIETEGVDAVFFGPFDLSVSMGVPGQIHHPLVEGSIQRMLARANARGIYAGMLGTDAESAQNWLERGADYVLVQQDTLLLLGACKQMLQAVRCKA